MDLTKFTYEDFCKALYSCKTAAEVRSLVESDYGHKLPVKGTREDALKAAYELICQNKAPATEPEIAAAPVPAGLGAGKYKVRIKATGPDARGRAGLRFTHAYSEHELSSEQVAAIHADPVMQIVRVG